MKATLSPDGTLILDNASETRYIRAEHPKFAALMRLYQARARTSLSSAHAPAGYTKSHPLQIEGQSFTGGEFIPASVMAKATPEEKAEVETPLIDKALEHPPAKERPTEEFPLIEQATEKFVAPPGYGGFPWKGGTPEPDKVYKVPTEEIHVDPERFQFKQNVNKEGVTPEFKDVAVWDPVAAGTLLVWYDPVAKKTFAINGHHRREMAGRMNVPDLNAMFIQAKNAQEARAIGAMVNIKEGRGTAMDAAKFMRDTGLTEKDMAAAGVSLKGKIAADATILAKLNDRLFNQVARGQMDEQEAISIARHLPDHNLQDQLANFLAKKKESGKEYAPKVIEGMAQEMAATPTHTTTESTLFGDITSEDSLFGERNELKQYVRNELSKDVNDFKAVSSKRRAEQVSGAGNTLNVEENKKIAEQNAQVLGTFDTLVNSRGPISDALNEGAKAFAAAKTKKAKDAAKSKTVEAVRAAVEREASGQAGPDSEGSSVPGGEATPAGDAGTAGADERGRDQAEPDGVTEAQKAKGILPDDFELSGGEFNGGFPQSIKFGELRELAKKKLGKRFHSIVLRKYGGGSQVEVLATKDGYHGREIVRKATFPISDKQAEQAWNPQVTDEPAKSEVAAPQAKTKPAQFPAQENKANQETKAPKSALPKPTFDKWDRHYSKYVGTYKETDLFNQLEAFDHDPIAQSELAQYFKEKRPDKAEWLDSYMRPDEAKHAAAKSKTTAEHLKDILKMTPEQEAAHAKSLEKYRERVTKEGDWDSGNKSVHEKKILDDLVEKGVLTKRQGRQDEMTANGLPTVYEPASAKDEPRIHPKDIAKAKAKLTSGNLQIHGSADSEPVKSDLSGEMIKRYVELPNGAKIHPDELHRAVTDDEGKIELHPHENLTVKDPLNKGDSVARTFERALSEVAAYPGHDNDRVTLQTQHGYTVTKTRAEWRDVAKDRAGESMSAWYDRENPPAVSEAAAKADESPKASVGSEEETEQFFKAPAEQQGLYKWDTPTLKPSTAKAESGLKTHSPSAEPTENASETHVDDQKEAIPVPAPQENAVKSKGHVAFVGKHEYYRGADGKLYKATIGSKINPKTGNRTGNLSSEGDMEKQRAKAATEPLKNIPNTNKISQSGISEHPPAVAANIQESAKDEQDAIAKYKRYADEARANGDEKAAKEWERVAKDETEHLQSFEKESLEQGAQIENLIGSLKESPATTKEQGNAVEDRIKSENNREEHQDRNEGGQAAEAGRRDRAEQGGQVEQEEVSSNPHIALADHLAERLRKGETISKDDLFEAANKHHGGTRAEGKYGPSDAYDSLEAGFNMALAGKTDAGADLDFALAQVEDLADDLQKLPTQTNRSGNKDSLQQFSTPPHYSFAVNWLANLKPEDTVLEPSAGDGSLAIHAANVGAHVILNEKDPRRAEFLKHMFGDEHVHEENAEQIGAILPSKGVAPTAVVMNPPFSQTAGRLGDKKDLMTGAKHITEALQTLQPGGRLVAIVGRGMKPGSSTYKKWFNALAEQGYTLRANVGVDGDEYKKYGTHFGTRTLIIDKVAPGEDAKEPVTGDAKDIPDLMKMLEGVRNDRPQVNPQPSGEPVGGKAAEASGPAGVGDNAGAPESGAVLPEQPGVGGHPEQPLDSGPEGRGAEADGGAGSSVSGESVSSQPGGIPGTTPGDERSIGGGVASPEGTPGPVEHGNAGGTGRRGRRNVSNGKSAQLTEPFKSQLRPSAPVELEETPHAPAPSAGGPRPAQPQHQSELGSSIYERYKPQDLHVKGAKPHPSPLDESAAMAAVPPPKVTYRPHLSPDIVEGKIVKETQPDGTTKDRYVGVSEAQLEAAVYAGQAHQQMLPAAEGEPEYRRGHLLGDGTGTGKGREIATIMTDNTNQGRKKHVWISQKQSLLGDAQRDWADLGNDPSKLFHFDRIRKSAVPPDDGVAFITYDTLKGRPKDPTAPSNLDELVKWLGPDFDGVIAFDECVPTGTMIDTPTGRRPIQDIKVGDEVMGFDHATGSLRPTRVTKTFQRITHEQLVKIGDTWMTGNHPVFTQNFGYIPAKCVRARDLVAYNSVHYGEYAYAESHLSGMQENLHDEAQQFDVLQQAMQRIGGGKIAGIQIRVAQDDARSAQGARQENSEVPGGSPEIAKDERVFAFGSESVSKSQGHQESRHGLFSPERRQWQAAIQSASNAFGTSGIVGNRVHGWREPLDPRLAKVLSHRFGGSGPQDSSGNRRTQSPLPETERTRREKDGLPQGARLDGVEVLEFERRTGHRSGSGENRGGREVFNIETETANYFAEGLLVHNCHGMGNALPMKGARGKTTASKRALAGIELQKRLPKARVEYVTATPATELANLGYMDRLGIWGRGTPFARKEDFISEMERGGIASMEAVPQSLKAMGLYTARRLSLNDGTPKGTVIYERLPTTLEPAHKAQYDALAEAWQHVLHNIDAAMEVTGASGSGEAKGAAQSQFWGAHQRFFNQIITSMQVPTVIKAMEKDIAEGRAPVVQLFNTMEASTNRALQNREEDEDLEELDVGPRDILTQYLQNSFPVHRYEQVMDDHGNVQSVLVKDSHGDPVEDPQAVAMRDELIANVRDLKIHDSPLDMIINHFGPDQVSEVTGRKQRLIWSKDEHGRPVKVVESRGNVNQAETQAFQDGKKKILVFSAAGGTGSSYHADKRAKNQNQRVHYPLQLGWRADNMVQGLGRTHRTNQASAPIVRLPVLADVPGNKRFTSSVARRLDQMGGLGAGQRQTGSQGVFSAADNLESKEAQEAVGTFFRDLKNGSIDGLSHAETMGQLGYKIEDEKSKSGRQKKVDVPPITQFLNRILSLKLDMQNKVFDAFEERLRAKVEQAQQDGTLDTGIENFPNTWKIVTKSDQPVYKEPVTGAESRHVVLTAHKKVQKHHFDEHQNKLDPPLAFVQNKQSGRVWAVYKGFDKTDPKSGTITSQYILHGPTSRTTRPTYELHTALHASGGYGNFTRLDQDEAQRLWEKEYNDAPEFTTSEEHFVTGAFLPIWDRIPGEHPKIYRLRTEDGQTIVGRHIPADEVDEFKKRMNIQSEGPQGHDIASIHGQLAGGQAIARLANGWKLKPTRFQNEKRIELTGPNRFQVEEMEKDGVFKEKRGSEWHYFIPVGEEGAKVLDRITKSRPIMSVEPIQLSQIVEQSEFSDDVKAEALRALRAMFPVSLS